MFNEDQAEKTAQPQEHKPSWFGGILEQLDTEFPLSGAETNKDLDTVFSHREDAHEEAQEQQQEQESAHEHKHSWLENVLGEIDMQFPLSGGEYRQTIALLPFFRHS